MIRFSSENDKENIISLWIEAFGDSKEDVEFFLLNKYIQQNTLIIEQNSKIVSMLFLLNGEMHINGEDYPAYYLYAACTAKDYRGKGLMASLLTFAQQVALNRGVKFICLKPAEKSLFDFYSLHGYKSVFKRKIVTVDINDPKLIDIDSGYTFSENKKKPNEIRNSAYSNLNYFKWDSPSVEFAFNHTKHYGGNIFESHKGYCIYSINNNKIYVKEYTFTNGFPSAFLEKASIENNINEIIIDLPVDYPVNFGKHRVINSEMILSVSPDAEKLLSEIKNAYLGLTLD